MSLLEVESADPTATALHERSGGRPPGLGIGGWIAVAVLVLMVLVALVGPLLVKADPNSISLLDSYGGPAAGHALGFDGQGRDLLARLVHGARSSLLGPLLVVVIGITLGSLIAFAAAWVGGAFDATVARVIDAMFAFPGLLLAIVAVSLFGPGLLAASIALAIGYTPYVARIVRSATLRERQLPYVAALTVQGLSGTRICIRHLLPNVSGIIVAAATLSYGYALIDLAALSFIGLGVQPPQSDWGVMVAEGVPGILAGFPQESLYAGLCIVVVVGAVNFLGDRITARAEARR
ncbi:ABC transporter permease [Angustibacter sp. McL0619]|uniref:ABC transporter permease n=1 Tax=Angustibacter sp. McL0619 TaxID=3415676 RepID=UPI003CEBBAF7